MKRILLVLLAMRLTANFANANLLTNGDFNLPNSVAAPDGWTAWTWNGGWANHQNDASSEDGSYYMAVGGGTWDDSGGGVYQMVPAVAGDAYTLTVDSGAQDWWSPEGEMRLFFMDASSNVLTQNTVVTVYYPNGTGQPWSNYTLTAVAPAGTSQAKVEFAMNGGGGTVWFDNADLTVVPEPGTATLIAGGLALVVGLRPRRRY